MICVHTPRKRYDKLTPPELRAKRKNRKAFYQKYFDADTLTDKDLRRYGLENDHIQF